MHQVIQYRLEEYLAGTLDEKAREQMDSHLTGCTDCREEVRAMREISALFRSMESGEAPGIAPGFYARVSRRIEAEHNGSAWSLFFEPLFIRRVAFASLLLLASLGTFLVSQETEFNASPSAEAIMAEYEASPLDQAPARDHMLVTLVSYQH
jgi:anti-sigma factor RsiW